MDNYLVKFNEAKYALEIAKSIDEVKQIRDQAECLRAYAKQAGESLTMQNHCAEIKLRAERRAGEMLKEMDVSKGRPEKMSHDATFKLDDLGINRTQSSRWQSIADIPENVFEQHLAKTVEEEKELTTNSVLKIAKEIARQMFAQECDDTPSTTGSVDDLQDLVYAEKKYGTIYTDPPWQYNNQGTRAATNNHYKTMTIDEITALPIPALAAEKCHLHLWVTKSFFCEGLGLLDTWGFEYRGFLTWVKPQMGLGNYWRGASEFLLLGVKGNMPFLDKNYMDWVQADRTKHSQKPDKIRQMIEQVSPKPRIELFAREITPGWMCWGNEIEFDLFSRLLNTDE